MNNKLNALLNSHYKSRRRRALYRCVCAVLALTVMLGTVYSLIIPAVTLSDGSQEATEAAEIENMADSLNEYITEEQLTEAFTEDESVEVTTEGEGDTQETRLALVEKKSSLVEVGALKGDIDNMKLNLYYCTYNSKASSSVKVGNYVRNGIYTESENNALLIADAYTDGSYNYYVPISYLADAYASYGYKFDEATAASAISPFLYIQNSNFNSSSTLGTTSYVQMNGKWYLKFKLLTQENSGDDYCHGYIYYVHLTQCKDTITPSSTVINLFDYWTTGRYDDDNHNSTATDLTSGINKNHKLKFGKGMTNQGDMNYSKGGTSTPSKVTQGIVANLLDSNGFPVLSGDTSLGMTESDVESLDYLFDPKLENVEGRAAFSHVGGLLCQDGDGYYSYDSAERCAQLDEKTNRMTVYDTPGVFYSSSGTTKGQFFPFNDCHQTAMLSATNSPVNHYFGMAMTARFIQQYDGYQGEKSNKPMDFSFTGDNDVWIFIDDVLVADLGGLRSAASVTINFADGSVTINDKGTTGNETGTPNTTIKQAFIDAGKEDMWEWNGNTFANNTIHTLKFFYLERGNYDSNLQLKYNLNQIPPNGVYKIDQYGAEVDGARFAVYKADKDYNYIADDGTTYTSEQVKGFTVDEITGAITDENGNEVITCAYDGTTRNGQLVFSDGDDMPYSIAELKRMFGDYFILRETDVPDGYRTVSDEIYLRIENDQILCSNTYYSGVWARATAQVTATNTLHVANAYKDVGVGNSDGTIDYYNLDSETGSNGTLFAVVLKRNGQPLDNVDSWYPVYGEDSVGYTVSSVSGVKAAIEAAQTNEKEGYSTATFTHTAGGMQITLDTLPGKIQRYFTYMQQNGLLSQADDLNPQYFVAYYYTTGTLDAANEKNTVRVISRSGYVDGYDGFIIRWGATISVPNIENRLFFQKKSEENELVNGAVFAMYNAYEAPRSGDPDAPNYIYYLGDDGAGNTIFVGILTSDENGGDAIAFGYDENGKAIVLGRGTYKIKTDGAKVGDYGVVSGDNIGTITVTIDTPADGSGVAEGTKYYVRPATNADGDALVSATHDVCATVAENGTGHYTKVLEGKYYIREIIAPRGYVVNTAEIPVLVDRNGVYANAGTFDNGVSVGNGIGYIVSTLDNFASLGQVDETLAWVYGALIRNDAEDFSAFEKVSGDVLHVGQSEGGWVFVKQDEDDPDCYGNLTTLNRSEAMVTYLQFAEELAGSKKDSIFDYKPNSDQSARAKQGKGGVATIEGENNIRLYTDEGWSDLAIYQDYAYGISQMTTGSTTNYDDLTEMGNISNLFSSSTWVVVTDTNRIDFDVKNVSASNREILLKDSEFVLWRTQENEEGVEVKQYYSGHDSETNSAVWTDESKLDSLDSVTLTTNESGRFTIRTIFDGTYYLKQTKPADGYIILTEPIRLNVINGKITAPTDSSITVEGTLSEGQTVVVPNGTGYRLPNTGGVGKAPFVTAGVLLMTAACVGYGIGQRKRKF